MSTPTKPMTLNILDYIWKSVSCSKAKFVFATLRNLTSDLDLICRIKPCFWYQSIENRLLRGLEWVASSVTSCDERNDVTK